MANRNRSLFAKSPFGKSSMEFRTIPLSKIVIPDYQRSEDVNRVNRIAADFEWEAIGVGVVTPGKNGIYYLCNAQHRYAAIIKVAEKHGVDIDDILGPVQVTSLAGFYLYCKINTNVRSLTNNEIFWAMYCGKVPLYVHIVKKLAAIGLSVDRSQSAGRPQRGTIKSTHSVYMIYRDYGKQVGNKVLSILSKRFSSPDGNDIECAATGSRFLCGIHGWLKKNKDLSGLDVALRKSTLSSADIIARAKDNSMGSGYSEQQEVAKQLQQIYLNG